MKQILPRRMVLKGSLALAVSFMSGCGIASQSKQRAPSTPTAPPELPLMGFRSVPRSAGSQPNIRLSADYEYQVLIPWGDPLVPSGPAYQYPPSPEDQAQQIGIGHDGMKFFPLRADGQRGILAVNNEYGRNNHVLGVKIPTSHRQVLTSQHAHGVTLVEIELINGKWQTVESQYARRIHANSAMLMSGPAKDHRLLSNRANNPVTGTFGNCSNGFTPWGTYLSCEENFNLYFGAGQSFTASEAQQRYGLNKTGGGYLWHKFDPRFDLTNADYANEANRFGWVVEIDPLAPDELPTKRSAMGRFKHEGAAVVEGAGKRIVVYMGDDQRFECIYKFVSQDNWQTMRAQGLSPLDEGILYAARFDADGSGQWLPLTLDNPKLAGLFADQGELLVNARLAATAAGATPMDRPEWTTVAPNGDVYCTLTNNHLRTTADAANPMAPNPNGQIIRWHDEENHLGLGFSWDHFLLADDVYETQDSLGSPDGLWADPDGRLFICTDGDQFEGMPNQLLVADTRTREISRLLVGVTGSEITGITTTPDRRTLFVNVQHPGGGDPASTGFPAAFDGKTVPRDCTLALRRKDGGIVGS